MFALDAFEGTHTVREQLGHFFMHLIPSFILLIVFFVATKSELIGGILFTLIGVALSPPVFILDYRMNESMRIRLSCHHGDYRAVHSRRHTVRHQ